VDGASVGGSPSLGATDAQGRELLRWCEPEEVLRAELG
jgi:hypothetical protein